MPGRRRYAQTRDDHHHCRAEPSFANHIAAELRQHVSPCGSLEWLRLNEESVARADRNEDGDECEFNEEKPPISRRLKRVN
jgi:hypothetical protein